MADNGHSNDATPQEIWSILRELAASQRETDRRMQETDRRMQETDRRMQETDRRLNKLDDLFAGQWGKLIEALVQGDLIALLNQRGIEVDQLFTNLQRELDDRRWEIDVIAANGDEVVAVEVKTTLKVRDVDHFLDTLRAFTRIMPAYADRRIYGAVAYLKADESSDQYAERRGLFVVRATGSSASITNRADFRPRTFDGVQTPA